MFAGIFLTVPVIGVSISEQMDFGQATGTVLTTHGSKNVSWASGNTFGKYLAGTGPVFNIVVGGQSNKVAAVTDATHLVLSSAFTGVSGVQPYYVPLSNTTSFTTSNLVTFPDGAGYNSNVDTPTWIAQDCSRNLPFMGFAAGRTDTSLSPAMSMWANTVRLANALKACHYGFAFTWNNGNHSTTGSILSTLEANYIHQLNSGVSYPAFTKFSLDNNYGNGSRTDGDCNSGTPGPTCYVNSGWKWTGVSETATSWSALISNSLVSSTATVDITPRNTQLFHTLPGSVVNWTATGGQGGQVITDSWGLATVTGLTVSPGPITITMTSAP